MHNRGRLHADPTTAASGRFDIGALLRALKTTPAEIERTLSRKARTSRQGSKRRRAARH